MKQYSDALAWYYEDLKVFNTEIMQHKIPLKPGSKPFKHKSRQFNPLLSPIIEKVEKIIGCQNYSATEILRVGR
jgi:hypothetical protein